MRGVETTSSVLVNQSSSQISSNGSFTNKQRSNNRGVIVILGRSTLFLGIVCAEACPAVGHKGHILLMSQIS